MVDLAGNVGTSAISTMMVDPNAGYLGSQPLFDLAEGVSYGTLFSTPQGIESEALPGDRSQSHPLLPGLAGTHNALAGKHGPAEPGHR